MQLFTLAQRATAKYMTGKFLRPLAYATVLATGLESGGLGVQSAAAGQLDPALWKLTDEDSVVYLFGTVHAQDESLQWRTDKINQAFKSADSYYMEAPVPETTQEEMLPLLQKYAFNKSGTPFYDQLTHQQYKNFVNALNSLGMPQEAKQNFAPLRPWFAAVMLAGVQMQQKGLNPEAGVDKSLWEDAKVAGKKLGYLETVERQLKIFGDMSPEEDLAMFDSSMLQMVQDTDMLDDIFTYWEEGEIEKLSELMTASFEGNERFEKALLFDRNADWADKIENIMLGSGTVFIAVGAGHLGGDQSLQWYLERLGYVVERQ